MSYNLEEWEEKGEYLTFSSFKVFAMQVGIPDASADKTLLLLHGFPESSFSYHLVVDGLLEVFERIILFDMIGYGFSDKPVKNYSYSLLDQADSALEVWNYFGVTGGHLLAHDMGVSVATELLARNENKELPSWFSTGFQSFTFTNGSMVLEMAKLRITQKFLLSKYGHLMGKVTTYALFKNQVKSAHGNSNLAEGEIYNMWKASTLQDGHKKAYLTIRYLNDRKKYEKSRWLPALSETKIPIYLCWGKDDSVARVKMAFHLKEHICPNATLKIMKGVGHFCQLGNPQEWIKCVKSNFERTN